ncbi:hypothetical protein BDFG_09149, partial [Blastomyces dermatitidis ATCC 26199]
IELLEVTVSRIKLFPGFSLNDHTGSYITVLTEGGGGVTTVTEKTENELNTDKLISRENDISLQGTVTTAMAVREAEEGGMTIEAVLSQLIDITVFIFNLTFLTVMKTAVTSQRYLLTRKHQNKSFIILQE